MDGDVASSAVTMLSRSFGIAVLDAMVAAVVEGTLPKSESTDTCHEKETYLYFRIKRFGFISHSAFF